MVVAMFIQLTNIWHHNFSNLILRAWWVFRHHGNNICSTETGTSPFKNNVVAGCTCSCSFDRCRLGQKFRQSYIYIHMFTNDNPVKTVMKLTFSFQCLELCTPNNHNWANPSNHSLLLVKNIYFFIVHHRGSLNLNWSLCTLYSNYQTYGSRFVVHCCGQ